MASIYPIVQEYSQDLNPDYISTNAYWVIVVLPFKYPYTFSRKKLHKGDRNCSIDNDVSTLTETKPPIIITDDCINLRIDTSKRAYTSSLNASLLDSGTNYLAEVMPGDWVFSWILNNENDYISLLSKIKDFKPCNGFNDGLKFVGRVDSVRKVVDQSPAGMRTSGFFLGCVGFREFDSQIFYDRYLAEQTNFTADWMAKLSRGTDEVLKTAQSQARDGVGGIDSKKAINLFIDLLLAGGISQRAANPAANADNGSLPIARGGGAEKIPDAPYAYVIPPNVGKLLGVLESSSSQAALGYADVLARQIGIQSYILNNENSKSGGFYPSQLDDLVGNFLPMAVDYCNRPLWAIMQEFLNPTINEMYTGLKPNANGDIFPTIVARQIPFSTSPDSVITAQEGLNSKVYTQNEYIQEQILKSDGITPISSSPENSKKFLVTSFLDLPRWQAHPVLIHSLDIGRSDSTRFNFIHIFGQASAQAGLTPTEQLTNNPPITDDQDIRRQGIRSYMKTVACSIQDTENGGRLWMEIMGDYMMGLHLSLTGSCSIVGVQAPICPGDNFEIDNVVYHIEAVSHSCAIQNGMKNFTTNLQLTNGMALERPANISTKNPDLLLYPGVVSSDNRGFEPGLTKETRFGKDKK